MFSVEDQHLAAQCMQFCFVLIHNWLSAVQHARLSLSYFLSSSATSGESEIPRALHMLYALAVPVEVSFFVFETVNMFLLFHVAVLQPVTIQFRTVTESGRVCLRSRFSRERARTNRVRTVVLRKE